MKFWGESGSLGVGGGEGDPFYEMFRTPLVIHEISRKPVEKLGVGGEVALESEVLGRAGETLAEKLLPDPVHVYAGGEWVIGLGEPLGETEAVTGGVFWEGEKEAGGVTADFVFLRALRVEFATR